MQSATQTIRVSKATLWSGRVLSSIAVLFLVFDAVMKLAMAPPVLEASAKLGLPENVIPGLGVVLLLCTVVYAIPQTSVLGAVLLTGYLGGAVATHLRAGDPAFPVVFPVLFGVVVWLGLFLRDARLRALIPLRGRGAEIA
jgi:hypothetical protein